jgi:DNA-binding CsgD family transcriptional regulator/tetratricopeptide (TPR) repeat protein
VNTGLVGRDTQIAEIGAFFSAASGAPAALAITGDTGIGKTALWRQMLPLLGRSARVLSCQPTPAERPLAFAALDDLLGEAAAEVLAVLPGPRRQAVEAALLRDTSAEPAGTGRPAIGRAPEPRALARGILDALRALSGTPLVIAIDDAQWLDRPSADVLTFCFRRLQDEPVSILLTFRDGTGPVPLGLDRALPPDRLGRLPLGPLSLGAVGEMLRSRLDTVLPRHTLTRLYEASGGNPFYALEYTRTLAEHPSTSLLHEPIPVPPSLSDLVRRHVRQLTPEVRLVGRLVAASWDPHERLIRSAYDDGESWAAIDRAVEAGLIERDGETLRFTHPLLRAVLYSEMPPEERRRVHQRLGSVSQDIEKRASHSALGADKPSEEIAGMLEGAARHAALRGAPGEAAALAGQATRLTPASGAEAARERTMEAADYHFRAGDLSRCRSLIESALPTCPVGPERAPMLLRLATVHYHQSGWPLAERTFRQAAEEALGHPALYAYAQQELALARMAAGDLPGAARLAAVSLRSAEQAASPRLIAHSLASVAVLGFLRGHGARLDLLDRAEALDASCGEEPVTRLPRLDPYLVNGLVLKWSDHLDEARLKLADRHRNQLERGDQASLPFLLYHFSELECWAGNWEVAEEYALEACRAADEGGQSSMKPNTGYALALIRAHRGRVKQAQELAREALARCDRTGNAPVRSLVLGVLGFIATSLGDLEMTHSHLGSLAEMASPDRGEPGVVKFLPDEIEALAALGEVDLAWSLTRQLEERGKSLGRPWALATAARCRAWLADRDGDLDGARAALAQALLHHKRLPMPFELGRTLLAQGTIERRSGHRPAARTALGQALGIFENLGAPLWAAKASRELSGLTTRAPAGGLTETERRVAALVTQGHTNREVAAAMFVTENTVQTHLRHIFQKLDVRSRTELTVLFLATPGGPAASIA